MRTKTSTGHRAESMRHGFNCRLVCVGLATLCLAALLGAGLARASSITAPATSASGSFSVSWTSGYELWLADVNWRIAAAPTVSASFSELPAGTYRFMLASCYWRYEWEIGYTYECAPVPASVKAVVVTGTAMPAIDEWSREAGTTAYRSTVSPRGGARLDVPLRTPPGVNGVALDLSLSYDSASGADRARYVVDDVLGYGWSLRGVPYIHRCRAGLADQPYPGGLPTMTAGDLLCLDGEPLSLAAGVHWRADAEYRAASNPDLRVTLRSTAGLGLWFEVRYPDGAVARFGDTADSRVLASGRRDFFTSDVAPNEPYFWGLRQLLGAPAGELTVRYQRFDGYGILQPALIAYGGAEVRFVYTARADLATVALDISTQVRRISVLNAVQVSMNGAPIREYRLASNLDDRGRLRLTRIQECGFDAMGGAASCLAPLRFDWVELATGVANHPVAISELVDGLDARTGFTYATVGPTVNPLTYAEAPFGAIIGGVDTAAANMAVVTEQRRSDGRTVGGTRRWTYRYKGLPLQSTKGRGYVGFHEVRSTDQQSGVVTYSQTRLDWPFLGSISQLRAFDAPFGTHTQELVREEHAYGHKTHANGSRHVYRARSTRWHLEGTTVVGGSVEQVSFCYRTLVGETCPATGAELDAVTQRRTVTTTGIALSSPSFTPAFWGDVPLRTIAAQNERRTVTEVTAFQNATAPWVRGGPVRRTVTHNVPGQSSRTVTENAAYLAGTRIVSSSTLFPGDARLARTVIRSFDGASGHALNAETVQGANAASRTTHYATPYQDGRYVAEATNPLEQTVSRVMDDRFGRPARIVDADGRAATLEYDPFGRVVREVGSDGTEVETHFERCDQADCGAVVGAQPGYRMTVTTRNGSVRTAPTRVTYFDVLDRPVLREVEALDPGQGFRSERLGYDDRDRVRYVSRPVLGGAVPACSAAGPDCTWLTYDVRDRVVREDRPDGGVTTTAISGSAGRVTVLATETVKTPGLASTSRSTQSFYDVLGHVTQTTEAYGSASSTSATYGYDAHGNLASVAVGGLTVATLEYDLAGNRTKATDASSGSTEFSFNALGELIRSTDAKGQTTTYEYDLLGRLVRRNDAGGVAHVWSWDPLNATGRLAARSRPGFSETYAYDAEYGRPVRVDSQVNVTGVWSGTQSRQFGYDTAGRLASQQFPNGLAVAYGYSESGYLARTSTEGKVLHEWRTTDPFGNPTDERFHDGTLRTAKVHEPSAGRLTRIQTGTTVAPRSIQDLEMSWQSSGALYRRSDLRNTATTADDYLDTFSYDAAVRLLRQTTSSGASRLLDFAYAPNGNLVDRTSSVAGDSSARSYIYGSAATPYRLTGATLSGVATAFVYDANGNVVQHTPVQGSGTWLRHDARNNVTRITVGPDENTVHARDEFWYDPDGRRFLSQETWESAGSQQVRRILYLGDDYEEVRPPAGATHDVVQRIQITPVVRAVRRRDASTQAWTVSYEYGHRDHLGSVDVITDATGSVLARNSFDPFGTRRSVNRASDVAAPERDLLLAQEDSRGSRGFAGHEHRNRTGFIHMNGRVYDPRIGRFVSPDPMVQAPWNAQNYNRYAYVLNSPLSLVDPTGQCGAEAGYDALGCMEFDELVRVQSMRLKGGRTVGNLGSIGVARGSNSGRRPDAGARVGGGSARAVSWRLPDAAQADTIVEESEVGPIEVVNVIADRESEQGYTVSTDAWIERGLANLARAGVRSLFGSGCVGAILGGCGAVSVDTSTGVTHIMLMVGVIPGVGVSVGTEGALFSSEFQESSGFGTAVFVTGGVNGVGGSIGMAQGTNGVNVTGTAGFGFGFGGGVGFYYSTPVGSGHR